MSCGTSHPTLTRQVHDFLMLRIFADPSSCPQPNEAMARVADFVLRTTGDPSDDVAGIPGMAKPPPMSRRAPRARSD